MAQIVKLGLALLCLVSEGAGSSPWWDSARRDSPSWLSSGSRSAAPGIGLSSSWSQDGSRGLPSMSPVALQCQEAQLVVTVQRDLFGTGKLVQAADLRLGAAFCRYTSINANNTVTFQIALQDCGNTVQMTPDSLIYSSVLTYNPTPSSSLVITRTNPAAVLIQCIYYRNANVSSNAIQPTWIPFFSTVYADGSFAFSLRLMNDDWSSARANTTFQLGDVLNIEASINTGNHVAMMIFVDSCVATLTPDKNASPRYDIITSNGCLVDGKLSDSFSAFISPRTDPDTLQFTVDAFRFIGDSRSLIYITCNLKAVDATLTPSAVNKACSYSSAGSWSPVEGPSAICSCCDTVSCTPFGGSRRAGPGSRRTKRIMIAKSEETTAVLGPLLILTSEESRSMALHGAVEESGSVLSLTLVGCAVVLSLVTLGAIVLYRRWCY